MNISVISLFPEMFEALNYGVVGRALSRDLFTLSHTNPRDFTDDVHRTVDDRPYGGGPGMVMKVEPLHRALNATKAQHANPPKVILLSPQGRLLTQDKVRTLAQENDLVLIAGRYEGVDERLCQLGVDEELSVGDYVVSGGELPAMLLIDAILRLKPGVLGHEASAEEDSFTKGLLDCPHYTRPEAYQGLKVPKTLQSGDHQAIAAWRFKEALVRTWQRRPELIEKRQLTKGEQKVLNAYIETLEERGYPDDE